MTKWELLSSGLSWLRCRELVACKIISSRKGRRWMLWWSYQELPDPDRVTELTQDPFHFAKMDRPRPMLVDTGAEVSIFPAGTVDFGTGTSLPLVPRSEIDPEHPYVLKSATGHPLHLRRITIPVFLYPSPEEMSRGVRITMTGYERIAGSSDTENSPMVDDTTLLGLGGEGSLSSFAAFVGLQSGCAALIR